MISVWLKFAAPSLGCSRPYKRCKCFHKFQLAIQLGTEMDKMDKIVLAHRKMAFKAQKDVEKFLRENAFDPGNPNHKRGKWWVTYPIHEAVKQNNPQMVALLLASGANPNRKDTWGRTAYSFAKSKNHQTVMNVLGQHQAAFKALGKILESHPSHPSHPSRPSHRGFTRNLHSSPPPHGFEEFFAELSKDPLVVPNCEAEWSEWLKLLGPKARRELDLEN